jgi:cysteine synthase A
VCASAEGLFVGPSAALNVVGAVKLARTLPPGSTVVTILCDLGDRYVTKTFNPAFLHNLSLEPKASGTSLDFVE